MFRPYFILLFNREFQPEIICLILCGDSDIFLLQMYACSQINHPKDENCDLPSYYAASIGDYLL